MPQIATAIVKGIRMSFKFALQVWVLSRTAPGIELLLTGGLLGGIELIDIPPEDSAVVSS